jgi:PAS domain S-box-containing protein
MTNRQPLKLLLVEDDPMDAELVLRELRRAGYEPDYRRVDTEAAYLDNLSTELEVILSDYDMPSFGGLRALKLLQQHGIDIPFIVISGTIGEQTAVDALKHGATDYLLKGSLTRLGQAVAQALEQARLRQERTQMSRALREAEDRYRSIFENAVEGIFQTSPDGRLLAANPAFARILGYSSPEEAMALITDTGQQLCVRPALRSEALRELRAKGVVTGLEIDLRRKDGRVIWVSVNAWLAQGQGGGERIEGMMVDISERIAAEQARERLEEQLRQSQKMEAIGQLAGGVAHDFNNILTIIQGNASLLLLEDNSRENSAAFATQIAEAAERASRLTRQLLLFSRKQAMQPADLDLNEIVVNLLRMLKRIVGEDVELRSECSAGLPSVHADAGMMEQVLLNLVVNARDAMPSGGRLVLATAEVSLDATEAAAHPEVKGAGLFVRLSVTDTGTGIPPEVVPRIFEPFFTTKEAGKGTGIGLATAYGIVQQHGGWIDVDSQVGRGTGFHIHLPAVRKTAAVQRAEVMKNPLPLGTEVVLVVEDEEAVRMLARNLLQRCGYTVLTAVSGRDALRVWEAEGERIDLVLTDIIMPDGLTGRELAVRLHEARPTLPVVYTSGYSPDFAAKGWTLVEGRNFLQKPYHPRKLAEIVRHCLDHGE